MIGIFRPGCKTLPKTQVELAENKMINVTFFIRVSVDVR